jgi:hypothetical protein
MSRDHPSHVPTITRLIDSITEVSGILDRPVKPDEDGRECGA